jgi:hypothetical protein
LANKCGAIRRLEWCAPAPTRGAPDAGRPPADTPGIPVAELAVLSPAPASAEEEAIALLRIAAEVEGALLTQYLYAAGSLLPGVSVEVPGFDHTILSDDWHDLIRSIARQEMGHLITVQNLLVSLDAAPHLDRENFPLTSPLYPFPFSLQPVRLATLAKYVCAEAPRQVVPADAADYAEAVRAAGAAVGEVPRAGQIYERLFWLLQDGDAPQDPWPDLQNPFPHWPDWHVDPGRIGRNQDRQADPAAWRGDDATGPADTAIYVLQVCDKASARQAIHAVGLQGEGPVGEASTHFDKFLRLYREQRAVAAQAGAPALARNQADDPRTGLGGAATITDPRALIWAKLANARYRILLIDLALSLSIGPAGTAPAAATRADFANRAFREMLGTVKPLGEELRQMPLRSGTAPDEPRAGLPFELPAADLPAAADDLVQCLRECVAESQTLRAEIESAFDPTPRQKSILREIDRIDTASQELA